MLNNHFINTPTAGNDESTTTIEELQARIHYLEERLAASEKQQLKVCEQQPPKKKIRWGKIRKFFNCCIKPILEVIPKIINAVANYLKATAEVGRLNKAANTKVAT